VVTDRAGLEDEGEDQDQGVIVEKETEWMITSLSVVAESRLTVSSAQLVVKHDLEDTIGERKSGAQTLRSGLRWVRRL